MSTDAAGKTTVGGEMGRYVRGLPADLAAVERARAWAAELPRAAVDRPIVLAGLGGSAVAGDIARALLREEARVPFEVIRDYRLPAWVGRDTPVLASSYSGDTEETLSAFDEAMRRGARVWVIASGGELGRRAEEAGLPFFRLPPGLPPRAALGHSLPPVLFAAAVLAGLDVAAQAEQVASAARRLRDSAERWTDRRGPAAEIARRLARSIPVFYAGTGLYEPAAVRWRGQLAENAKMLSFHHLLPEMDHNEIVGWQENPELLRSCRAVFLTGSHDHPRVARRVAITRDLIAPHAGGVEVVSAPAGTPAEELLGLIWLGDWVSLYVAEEHGIDPLPVERISRLKAALRDPAGVEAPA